MLVTGRWLVDGDDPTLAWSRSLDTRIGARIQKHPTLLLFLTTCGMMSILLGEEWVGKGFITIAALLMVLSLTVTPWFRDPRWQEVAESLSPLVPVDSIATFIKLAPERFIPDEYRAERVAEVLYAGDDEPTIRKALFLLYDQQMTEPARWSDHAARELMFPVLPRSNRPRRVAGSPRRAR